MLLLFYTITSPSCITNRDVKLQQCEIVFSWIGFWSDFSECGFVQSVGCFTAHLLCWFVFRSFLLNTCLFNVKSIVPPSPHCRQVGNVMQTCGHWPNIQRCDLKKCYLKVLFSVESRKWTVHCSIKSQLLRILTSLLLIVSTSENCWQVSFYFTPNKIKDFSFHIFSTLTIFYLYC